jgi:membrane protein DedA with SNARE-associated domain
MQRERSMKIGIWVTILGILALVVGGAMYLADYHRTIGSGGAILGLVLLVVGVAWWTMKDRTAPKSAAAQPAQPSQPAKTP